MARKGDWTQTYSGIAFWPLDPRPEEILIEDIAHALSRQCRFAGHIRNREFYSVAEHSLLVSQHVPHEYALWGLLHDAAEAYIGDMVRPLKKNISQYEEIERQIMHAVCSRFGLPQEMPTCVQEMDTCLLFSERAMLLAPPPYPWEHEQESKIVAIIGLFPETAKREFLFRYHELIRGN